MRTLSKGRPVPGFDRAQGLQRFEFMVMSASVRLSGRITRPMRATTDRGRALLGRPDVFGHTPYVGAVWPRRIGSAAVKPPDVIRCPPKWRRGEAGDIGPGQADVLERPVVQVAQGTPA
jgi:hypothetical protein